MPDAGSKGGVAAIIAAFEGLLQSYLQAAIDETLSAIGAAYALSAPADPHGYSRSRYWPRDLSPAIRMVKVSGGEQDEVHSLGCPRITDAMIELTVLVANKNPLLVEEQLEVYVESIRRVLLRYWRTTAATTCLQEVVTTSDERGSSEREALAQGGLRQLRGSPPESTHEQASIYIRCTYAAFAPVEIGA